MKYVVFILFCLFQFVVWELGWEDDEFIIVSFLRSELIYTITWSCPIGCWVFTSVSQERCLNWWYLGLKFNQLGLLGMVVCTDLLWLECYATYKWLKNIFWAYQGREYWLQWIRAAYSDKNQYFYKEIDCVYKYKIKLLKWEICLNNLGLLSQLCLYDGFLKKIPLFFKKFFSTFYVAGIMLGTCSQIILSGDYIKLWSKLIFIIRQ